MISFAIKNIRLSFSFSFFALLAVIACTQSPESVLLPMLCCLLHECGHIAVMIAFGTSPEEIRFYGGGIRLTPDRRLLSLKQDIVILSAGCLANFLTGLCALFLGFDNFFAVSFALGLFNLLPFKYFDGGRIIELVLNINEKGRRIFEKIRKTVSAIIILLCVLVMIAFGLNLSLCVTIVYIVVCELCG